MANKSNKPLAVGTNATRFITLLAALQIPVTASPLRTQVADKPLPRTKTSTKLHIPPWKHPTTEPTKPNTPHTEMWNHPDTKKQRASPPRGRRERTPDHVTHHIPKQ